MLGTTTEFYFCRDEIEAAKELGVYEALCHPTQSGFKTAYEIIETLESAEILLEVKINCAFKTPSHVSTSRLLFKIQDYLEVCLNNPDAVIKEVDYFESEIHY